MKRVLNNAWLGKGPIANPVNLVLRIHLRVTLFQPFVPLASMDDFSHSNLRIYYKVNGSIITNA